MTAGKLARSAARVRNGAIMGVRWLASAGVAAIIVVLGESRRAVWRLHPMGRSVVAIAVVAVGASAWNFPAARG
jgi:hypothetical protein